MSKPEGSLTSAQHEIMAVVWESATQGARWPRSGKASRPAARVGRTTILNLVDRLEKRGWLVRRDRQKPCHYLAALGREETAALSGRRFCGRFFRRLGQQPCDEPVGLQAAEARRDRAVAAHAGIDVQTVPREEGEIAMPGLEAIMPLAEAVSYLVNLAVAVSLVCGVGLLAARLCRHGSAPLRHGVLLGTLVLILLSPAAVWLAEQNGLALVRVTISSPPEAHAASIGDADMPSLRNSPCHSRGAEGERIAPSRDKRSRLFRHQSPRPARLPEGEAPGAAAAPARSLPAGGGATVPPAKISGLAWWQVMASVVALLWAMGTALGLLRLGWGYWRWPGFAAGSIRCSTRGRTARASGGRCRGATEAAAGVSLALGGRARARSAC